MAVAGETLGVIAYINVPSVDGDGIDAAKLINSGLPPKRRLAYDLHEEAASTSPARRPIGARQFRGSYDFFSSTKPFHDLVIRTPCAARASASEVFDFRSPEVSAHISAPCCVYPPSHKMKEVDTESFEQEEEPNTPRASSLGTSIFTPPRRTQMPRPHSQASWGGPTANPFDMPPGTPALVGSFSAPMHPTGSNGVPVHMQTGTLSPLQTPRKRLNATGRWPGSQCNPLPRAAGQGAGSPFARRSVQLFPSSSSSWSVAVSQVPELGSGDTTAEGRP